MELGDLLEQLTNQYSDYTSATDAARALIKIKQREEETLSELASRVLRLAKVAYKDAVQREGRQLATGHQRGESAEKSWRGTTDRGSQHRTPETVAEKRGSSHGEED